MNEVVQLLFKLSTYFFIYSFIGWVLESVLKTIISKKPVNSGFLHGPFCPIYGLGAIIMYLTLNKTTNIIVTFLFGFIVLSIWEYIVGWLLEKTFQTKYWDYSNSKFNIKGRVCLLNSIFWGILGVIFIYYLNPFITDKINNIPKDIIIYTNIILYIYLIVDVISSIIKVKNIEIKLNRIKQIKETINEKLEEIKQIGENIQVKHINKQTIQQKIEELKKEQEKLRIKLYKYANRLKKAFPTMKSDTITNILKKYNKKQ